VISAGDDTTGIANTVTLFNIFNDREIHDRLLAELKTVMPTPNSHVSYIQLEALPYLVRALYPILTPKNNRTDDDMTQNRLQ
jgi:hypothetical protein